MLAPWWGGQESSCQRSLENRAQECYQASTPLASHSMPASQCFVAVELESNGRCMRPPLFMPLRIATASPASNGWGDACVCSPSLRATAAGLHGTRGPGADDRSTHQPFFNGDRCGFPSGCPDNDQLAVDINRPVCGTAILSSLRNLLDGTKTRGSGTALNCGAESRAATRSVHHGAYHPVCTLRARP